jgi:Tfp pilus assembly protein PilX
MLNLKTSRNPSPHLRGAHRQDGIVMILALIVLVALTLAAVALTRSVSTSNTIADNLAFQQATTHSADRGVEAAVKWLETNNGQPSSPDGTATTCGTGSTVLACDQAAQGYIAHRQDPDLAASPPVTWPAFWASLKTAGSTFTLAAVDNGNTVSYVIQRMCTTAGDATSSTNACSIAPAAVAGSCAGGSSCNAGGTNLNASSQVYYRITVQVSGPRNTQSFVQTIVAL